MHHRAGISSYRGVAVLCGRHRCRQVTVMQGWASSGRVAVQRGCWHRRVAGSKGRLSGDVGSSSWHRANLRGYL